MNILASVSMSIWSMLLSLGSMMPIALASPHAGPKPIDKELALPETPRQELSCQNNITRISACAIDFKHKTALIQFASSTIHIDGHNSLWYRISTHDMATLKLRFYQSGRISDSEVEAQKFSDLLQASLIRGSTNESLRLFTGGIDGRSLGAFQPKTEPDDYYVKLSLKEDLVGYDPITLQFEASFTPTPINPLSCNGHGYQEDDPCPLGPLPKPDQSWSLINLKGHITAWDRPVHWFTFDIANPAVVQIAVRIQKDFDAAAYNPSLQQIEPGVSPMPYQTPAGSRRPLVFDAIEKSYHLQIRLRKGRYLLRLPLEWHLRQLHNPYHLRLYAEGS